MDNKNIPEEHMKWIFHFGARPLWKYLKQVLNIDISEVCAYVTKIDKFIETEGYKLIPKIVSLPHNNEVSEERFNNDVCFLINSINTVMESLKMVVQKDDEFILRKYLFKMDEQHNMYLVDNESNEKISDLALAICIK